MHPFFLAGINRTIEFWQPFSPLINYKPLKLQEPKKASIKTKTGRQKSEEVKGGEGGKGGGGGG